MKGLHNRGRAVLAALLLACLGATAVVAAPAEVVPADGPSLVAWLEGWLARLVPEWVAAASESQPPETAGRDGILFDDSASLESCDPAISDTCTGGEGLPDFDPDG